MTVAGIISAILVGLVIGALGRLVVPGRQAIPIWLTIIVGIIAAFSQENDREIRLAKKVSQRLNEAGSIAVAELGIYDHEVG